MPARPLDEPSAPGETFYLNLLGHAVGWPSPRGGAERLTDSLTNWALDGPIPWQAPGVREAGTVHVGGAERGSALVSRPHKYLLREPPGPAVPDQWQRTGRRGDDKRAPTREGIWQYRERAR